MSKASRNKGKRGELEVRDIIRRHDFDADRDGRLDDDLRHNVEGYHFEAKRCETLRIPQWMQQAKRDAGNRIPIIAHRRNNEEWLGTMPLDDIVRLLAIERRMNELNDLVRNA